MEKTSLTPLPRFVSSITAAGALLIILGFASCGPEDDWSDIVDEEHFGNEACDNLDRGQCLFPFPTNFFRSESGDEAELLFSEHALPSRSEVPPDGEGYRRADGFSAITPIYFTLEDATLEGAPPWNDVDASLDVSSATLIIDAETGEFKPHWAEIDVFSMRGDEPTPVIALRLPLRLDFGKRYIVAVTGLQDEDGSVVQAAPGFAPLRDREPSRLRRVGERREHFEKNIFPVLEDAGINRQDLQLAWDFTTRTEDNANSLLLQIRDKVFEEIGEQGPDYEIDEIEESPNDEIARLIRGRAMVPSFLTGQPGEIQKLRLDTNGVPIAEGYEKVEFELQIPLSVWEGDRPAHVVQYGHGLLGQKSQARGSWLRRQANEQGFLILGVDMQGMTCQPCEGDVDGDLRIWLDILLKDLSSLPYIADKIHQGLVNHLAVVRMIKGQTFLADERITREDGSAYYDPERIHYYGISQGGTMGSVMMSIQKDINRGVLGVPGAGFAFLLTRATLFVEAMGLPVILQYADDMRDFVATMGLVQVAMDPVDAINYLHRITENTFDNTPSHRVLLHVAREDAQVHNQVSDLVARASDATLLSPVVRPVWGLETSPGPLEVNAMVEYDFGLPQYPNDLVPMDLDFSHGCLRRLPEVQLQIDHFFQTGEVKDFCDWHDNGCFVPKEWYMDNCRPSDWEGDWWEND